jgi:hypothetical protein
MAGYVEKGMAKWTDGLGNRKLGNVERWVNKLER